MVVNKHKDIIINKYTEYNEDERLVSDRGHNLEYLTTMRYIQKFLKPDAKILEIGAATGRYSIALAKMGYDVTAVDLTPRNVEVMKSKSKRLKNFNCMVGDALDLSMFEDKNFELYLCKLNLLKYAYCPKPKPHRRAVALSPQVTPAFEGWNGQRLPMH